MPYMHVKVTLPKKFEIKKIKKNRSHEEDSKAFLKVGEMVGVTKYSSKQRTNTSNTSLYSLFLIHSFY